MGRKDRPLCFGGYNTGESILRRCMGCIYYADCLSTPTRGVDNPLLQPGCYPAPKKDCFGSYTITYQAIGVWFCGVCPDIDACRKEEKTEKDPTGRKNSDPGAKVDDGKLRYTLIPCSCLKWLATLWTRGAKKYSPNGWKDVPDGQARYADALMRHFEAWRAGEWMDKDTKVPHLIAVAWNSLVITWLVEHNKGLPEI